MKMGISDNIGNSKAGNILHGSGKERKVIS